MDEQLAWYIAGPVLGLCVVACRAVFGARLGVTGGFTDLVDAARTRRIATTWRGWFVVGVLAGGTVFAVAAGGASFEGYGWVTDTFSGAQQWLIVPVLFGAGLLVGYGAKVAGGCTSGNGLSGVASLSQASLAATATFFATAIAVSFAVEAVI